MTVVGDGRAEVLAVYEQPSGGGRLPSPRFVVSRVPKLRG